MKSLRLQDFKTQEEAMRVVDEIISRQQADNDTPEFWQEHPPRFSESNGLLDEFYYINDQGCPCMYASIIIIRKIQLVPAYIYYHLQLMTYRHSVQVCDRLSPLDRSRRWRARV